MTEMNLVDVLTVPGYRPGPSVLGLFTIGLIFLVPGIVAPIGLLQLVGGLWMLAALLTAGRDVAHTRSTG